MLPQIVLDTNVLFAGLHSRKGAAFMLLNEIGQGRVNIHLSVPVVVEYADVLKREATRLGMSEAEIEATLNSLCAIGEHHEIYFLWRPTLPDPKDELFLELAVAAQCPCIVTHNLRDFKGCQGFGIDALSPVQFLKRIGVIL